MKKGELFDGMNGYENGIAPLTFELGRGAVLEMMPIKAGSFMMGSPKSEEGRWYNETQHRVTLTKDFYLGKYEVTQEQWEAVMGNNPSSFEGAKRPVENVSWHDAKTYCEKLNDKYREELPKGYEFRLPTEAEWEYACRAGTTTRFAFGDQINKGTVNYSGSEKEWNFNGSMKDVGSYAPNAWGLYDMHGNVWEWCEDWYGAYPATSVTDPTGPSFGYERVYRGGSWGDNAWICRSAYRDWISPGFRYFSLGFRLALAEVVLKKDCGTEETSKASSTAPIPSKQTPKETEDVIKKATLSPLTFDLGRGVALEMMPIKAGSFMMGSPKSEEGREGYETQHQVTLTQDFYLGETEVTQAQWEAVMGSNPSFFNGSNRPVEQVSWEDAKKFCRKLNDMYRGKLPSGYEFRLPTEAQWEYACRAGTTTRFAFGNSISKRTVNYSGSETELDFSGSTKDVKSYAPNDWGLYDMHGNVWEWCEDWYGAYPTTSVTNPAGPSTGSDRVNRGGSWCYFARLCRSADRDSDDPGYRKFNLGFRLALAAVQRYQIH